MQNRIDYISNLKAIGILAIFLGHAPSLSTSVEALLYGFHVPLFFIVSGLLISKQKLDLGWREFLASSAIDLLVPYAVFFVVSYFYWLATKDIGNSALRFQSVYFYEPLIGFFRGTGSSIIVNVVLWFFPALFMARVLYYFSRKWLSSSLSLLFLCLLSYVHYLFFGGSNFRFLFGADCALYGAVFIAFGYLIKPFLENLVSRFGLIKKWCYFFVFLAIYLFFVQENGKPDLNNVHLGEYFHYFAAALFGFFSVFFIACLVRSGSWTQWLSDNTLYIFPLHWIIFRFITGVLQVVFKIQTPYVTGGWWWSVFYLIISLLIMVPIVILMKKIPFRPFSKRGL